MNNTVELLGYYGGDKTHALSAWTSTSRELNPNKEERIPALLKMLAENKHYSPFEKSSLHFLVTTDIASHIHIIKHRIGVSVNGESARYKELKEDKYYIPKDWQNIKVSDSLHFGYSANDQEPDYCGANNWDEVLKDYNELGNQLYHQCIDDLVKSGMDRKRAKESARYFKTYSSQITADVMFNFKSFAHFQGLRNKPDAQLEIREIAQQMLEQVRNIDGNPFEHTLTAFGL